MTRSERAPTYGFWPDPSNLLADGQAPALCAKTWAASVHRISVGAHAEQNPLHRRSTSAACVLPAVAASKAHARRRRGSWCWCPNKPTNLLPPSPPRLALRPAPPTPTPTPAPPRRFTYFDVAGRSVVVLRRRGVTPEMNVPFSLTYRYPLSAMARKPLLLVAGEPARACAYVLLRGGRGPERSL